MLFCTSELLGQCILPEKLKKLFSIIIINIVVYSGMDAKHPEILFYFTQSFFLPPLRRLWGTPGSNPELLRSSLVHPVALAN
jgi:hypothetical protein